MLFSDMIESSNKTTIHAEQETKSIVLFFNNLELITSSNVVHFTDQRPNKAKLWRNGGNKLYMTEISQFLSQSLIQTYLFNLVSSNIKILQFG